jgi:streptogramin lyase
MRISLRILLASSCVLVLSGCSGMPGANSTGEVSNPAPGATIQGKVHGGQNPIVGAHVYLYAINNTGYGGASLSVLNSTTGNPADINGNYYVTTDSSGNFDITGDYTCTEGISHLYIYAIGGDPGSGPNSAAGLMASLQSCTNPNFSSQFVTVNEVSTVATAYALAGFAVDATHFSIPNDALAATGMNNASKTVGNIETLSTGVALAATPAGNGVVPQSEIDTLANILAACINSTGPGSSACATLFANAMNGSAAPTETATAALNIAHNPGANIASLYALQTATSPFQPDLGAAPSDFTIALNYSGGGLDLPFAIAIDASGDVWIANLENDAISEFSPTGSALSGSAGFTGSGLSTSDAIAIDASGNVWVAGNPHSMEEFNSSGAAISGSSGYTGGGLDSDVGLAIDASSNVWAVSSAGNNISKFNSGGTAISGSSGYTAGGLNQPDGIAIDISGNVWTANYGFGSIGKFNSAGATLTGSSGFTGGGLDEPRAIAIDSSGNAWTVNDVANSLSEFSSSGTAISGTAGFTGGGLSDPQDIAIDGAGNLWVTNYNFFGSNTISEFNSSGTAITGAAGFNGDSLPGGNFAPYAIAIDGSGNVWITNHADSGPITELVGAATPVVTPIVANLLAPYGSHAVNEP